MYLSVWTGAQLHGVSIGVTLDHQYVPGICCMLIPPPFIFLGLDSPNLRWVQSVTLCLAFVLVKKLP